MQDRTIAMLRQITQQLAALQQEISSVLEDVPTVQDFITSMERSATNNSRSPMWRCQTANGERVNIFKHDDPEKNNFALFEAAGYGELMLPMEDGDELYWHGSGLPVRMRRMGKWWEIVAVEPRNGRVPDTLPEWLSGNAPMPKLPELDALRDFDLEDADDGR